MWDADPDLFDTMDDQDFEYESTDDFADFDDMGELSEAEALDEYSSYFDEED